MIVSEEDQDEEMAKGAEVRLLLLFWLQQPDSSQMVDLNNSNRTMSLKPNSQCLGNDIAESLPKSWQVNMKVHTVYD